MFKTIGYDLGIPLSYRFLRRYARVNRIDMQVLTLARYILEFTLMEYAIVGLRDSKLACAALFIAMRMNDMPGWNKTLEFYSGRAYAIWLLRVLELLGDYSISAECGNNEIQSKLDQIYQTHFTNPASNPPHIYQQKSS